MNAPPNKHGFTPADEAELAEYSKTLEAFRKLAAGMPGRVDELRAALRASEIVTSSAPLSAQHDALRADIDAYLAAIESGEIKI